jgi:YVTN family beta-propeller protein
MSSVLTPDGKYLLVLNCGYRPPSITVIDTATATVKSTTPVPDAWLGLTMTPRGDRVYVGGGSKASIFEFALANGVLTAARTFPLVAESFRTYKDFTGDVAFDPQAHLLYATDLYKDFVVVVNPQSGLVISRIKTGRRPYRILFNPDGKSIYVSNWADGNVSQYDVNSGERLAIIRVASHPTDLVWRDGAPENLAEGETANYKARIFVAAASTNNVYAIGVAPGATPEVVESISFALTPRQPVGMTPSGLALSPDKKRLYVACSDGNVVGVADISSGRSRVEGFIPAGWYPTAVRTLADGHLLILNGKGVASYPNPQGPSPRKLPEPVHKGTPNQYFVARMQTGTVSWIDPFTDQHLTAWTRQALSDSLYSDAKLDERPALPPIEHVIYIVKENRTYDQVLGDMKEGNGDPSLCLFDEKVTPNLHKIAREFVLLDNFYVNADVSADGHNWSTAAIAPDYVQKLWPNSYAGRRKGPKDVEYDYEEQDPASIPPAGYLWSNANAAGLSIRNFGYMVTNAEPLAAVGADQLTAVRDPVLAKVTNRAFRGFDLAFKDTDRASIFLKEFATYEQSGQMPRLIVMRLGNDHTNGTAAGRRSPLAYAGDNDLAVGEIVEAVSKSKFWTSTAIFIVEDDAQNGPDHVDSHRSPAYVISAFIKRHSIDSNMYNTTSLLRTMETMLGLHPMTQFDAAAPVIAAPFQQTPDARPYIAEKARVDLEEINKADAPGAKESGKMNFADADDVDEDLLNRILWRDIKGDAPMPAPVRSYFGK